MNFDKTRGDSFSTENMVKIILLLCAGLVLPVFFIVAAKMLSFSYAFLLEDVAKAAVIFFLILNLRKPKNEILLAVIFGALFSISESFLYLNDILSTASGAFVERLFITVPLHILTALVILLPALKSKWLIFLGLGVAMLIHLLFNSYVAGLI